MKRVAVLLLALSLLTACSRPQSPPPAPPEPNPAVAPPQAAPEPPYQPGPKHQEALKLIGQEDYRGAEALLRDVVAVEAPNAAEAWNDLSFVQARLGRYSQAADSAKKALQLQPDFVYAKYNFGFALLHDLKTWQDAKPFLEASVKAQPDRPEPLAALGLWHEMAGNKAEAMSLYERAAAMGDKEAQRRLAALQEDQAKLKAAQAEAARFPDVPAKVITDVLTGWMPEGTTRRVERVFPTQLRRMGFPIWALLLVDNGGTYESMTLRFQTEHDNDYLGECKLATVGPGALPPLSAITLTLVPWRDGEHVLVNMPGQAMVCGMKGRYATEVLTAKTPVEPAPGGLKIKGELHRFVPEVSEYLPAAKADALVALVTEVRAGGWKLETDEAVWAAVNLGRPGMALASTEGVAYKPESEPVVLFPFDTNKEISYPFPREVGAVSPKGHTFLAVSTIEPHGPNGGDVLVLEYSASTRTLKSVFHGTSDAAGFTDDSVYLLFKRYRPEGGSDYFTIPYEWKEDQRAFVKGEAQKVDMR